MSAGKKKKKSDSLGVKIVNGKTVIQYANGILTEDGFEIDTEYDDSTEGVCHLISDDMLYYNKTKNFIRYYTSYIDLDIFASFCIESENLLDGFLWGIALNTWFVISKQLNESQCPTPVVFFIGESGTLKTSVARMFLTTGTYRNGQFFPFKVTTPVSIKDLKKKMDNVHASLILLDDIHEMFGYGTKKKIQDNIESICNDFYDYTNDCSLVATIKKGVDLEFSDSLLQRSVFIDFSGVMKADFQEKERYFSFNREIVYNVLVGYQSFLLKRINNEDITSDSINCFREELRNNQKSRTDRQNDIIAVFRYSMKQFTDFCFQKEQRNRDKLLDEFNQAIKLTEKRTLFNIDFTILPFEKRIWHCLEYMGQSKDFVIIKPEKCKLCRNFKPDTNNFDIECAKFKRTLSENNICDMYMNISCQLRRGASNCKNLDLIESYQPKDMYLNSNWNRHAVLLEYLEDSGILHPTIYNKLYGYGDYSLMIAAVKPFQRELRRLYIRECQKHNIEVYELSERDITASLNKLGIIAYTTRKYDGSKERKDYVFSDGYPSEKVYILRLPLEICKKISKNIDEFDRSNINYDNTLNSKFTENEEKNLYNFFTNLTRIKFEERK